MKKAYNQPTSKVVVTTLRSRILENSIQKTVNRTDKYGGSDDSGVGAKGNGSDNVWDGRGW